MIVPWQTDSDWEKKLRELSNRYCAGTIPNKRLAEVAESIRSLYLQLDPLLESLCAKSCPGCVDVCCRRATVWYDEKDVVFLLLIEEPLPLKQVYRLVDGRCCHLGDTGCTLPRYSRPFICTWYICPAQKELLLDEPDQIIRYIDELKVLRARLVNSPGFLP